MAFCMAGSLFAGTAIARQAGGDAGGVGGSGNFGSSQPPAPGYSTLSPSSSRGQQSQRLSQLMGATVKDQQGNSIGQINDFVVNPMSGRIQFAVISLNDQSGKLTAVPWQMVRPGSDPTTCVVTASKDKLDDAQTFDASSWPDFTQPSTSRDIYSHYGMQMPAGRSGYQNQGGTGENESGYGTGHNENQGTSGPRGNNGNWNSGNSTGGTGNNGTGNTGNYGTGNSGTGNYGTGNNGNSGNNNNPRNP